MKTRRKVEVSYFCKKVNLFVIRKRYITCFLFKMNRKISTRRGISHTDGNVAITGSVIQAKFNKDYLNRTHLIKKFTCLLLLFSFSQYLGTQLSKHGQHLDPLLKTK